LEGEGLLAEDEKKRTVTEGKMEMARWLSRGADSGVEGRRGGTRKYILSKRINTVYTDDFKHGSRLRER